MEYNTARPRLIIPEYGRAVQQIAESLMDIEDRAERNAAAHALVNIMGQINPQLREQAENKQKFWDHLFVLTNFELEVDSPFEKPSPEEIFHKPKPLAYQNNRIRFRHYGKNVEQMIAHAITMEESPQKDAFVNSLASYMKMAYWMWNNDKAPDEVIIDNIREMSGGKLQITHINEFITHNETYIQKKKDQKKQMGFKNKNLMKNKNPNQNRPGQQQHRNKPGGPGKNK